MRQLGEVLRMLLPRRAGQAGNLVHELGDFEKLDQLGGEKEAFNIIKRLERNHPQRKDLNNNTDSEGTLPHP